MSLNIKTTTNVKDPAMLAVDSILRGLKAGKKVLLFVTGGSSISVAEEMSQMLQGEDLRNLTVMLTDERYGPVGHPDSNWQQLLEGGFDLADATLIPVLVGEDMDETVKIFCHSLKEELDKAEYKIGLFGIGMDGHTAGIIPESVAVKSKELACGYIAPSFSRITITFNTIEKLDEAIVWMQGAQKWGVIDKLKEEIEIEKQPAQILKKVPLLTIFTDYKTG